MEHSPETVADLQSESSGENDVGLITLVVDGGEPVYIAEDNENLISLGRLFRAGYAVCPSPRRTGEQIPATQITISNIDRSLVEAIRTAEKILVTRELVFPSRPDEIIDGPYRFELVEANYDELVIRGKLGFEPVLNEKFPSATYNPVDTPAVFA